MMQNNKQSKKITWLDKKEPFWSWWGLVCQRKLEELWMSGLNQSINQSWCLSPCALVKFLSHWLTWRWEGLIGSTAASHRGPADTLWLPHRGFGLLVEHQFEGVRLRLTGAVQTHVARQSVDSVAITGVWRREGRETPELSEGGREVRVRGRRRRRKFINLSDGPAWLSIHGRWCRHTEEGRRTCRSGSHDDEDEWERQENKNISHYGTATPSNLFSLP